MMMSSTSRLSLPAFGIDVSATGTLRISGQVQELTLRVTSPSGWMRTGGSVAAGKIISATNGLLRTLASRIPESALSVNDSLQTPTLFRQHQ